MHEDEPLKRFTGMMHGHYGEDSGSYTWSMHAVRLYAHNHASGVPNSNETPFSEGISTTWVMHGARGAYGGPAINGAQMLFRC